MHQLAHKIVIDHFGDVICLRRVLFQIDVDVDVQDQPLRGLQFEVMNADAGLNGQAAQKHATAICEGRVVRTHGARFFNASMGMFMTSRAMGTRCWPLSTCKLAPVMAGFWAKNSTDWATWAGSIGWRNRLTRLAAAKLSAL